MKFKYCVYSDYDNVSILNQRVKDRIFNKWCWNNPSTKEPIIINVEIGSRWIKFYY